MHIGHNNMQGMLNVQSTVADNRSTARSRNHHKTQNHTHKKITKIQPYHGFIAHNFRYKKK